jgi:AcrR family transcriptional regulator
MIRKTTAIRRKQILEASRGIVVKYGSENVTIRRIANEVGITEGAIYRHFKSKKDVLSGLADLAISDLLQDVAEADISSGDKLEAISKILDKHLLLIEQRKGASFQVIAEIISFGDKKLNKKIYDGTNLYVDRLREMLALCIDGEKGVQKTDLEAATFILFGMIQGLVNIWTLSNYSFDLHERYSLVWAMYRQKVLGSKASLTKAK